MATGLDVAAGAAGFVSLGVLLLQGCVKGFILLSTAQNFGKDADIIRSEIDYEQYRLFKWAEKVGLENGSPIRNMDWEIVHGHLKRLEALLCDTAKFKYNYRLELVTTEDKLSLDDLTTPKKGFRRFFAPELGNETARTLHKGVSVWKRLKWAAIDKEGISLLIGDIKRFIDDLWALLQYDDLAFIRSGIEALLRHAISQTQESTELSQIEALVQSDHHQTPSRFEDGAVKSALFLKQQSLMYGYDDGRERAQGGLFTPRPISKSLSGATLVNTVVADKFNSPRSSFSKKAKSPRGPLSYKLLKLRPESNQHEQFRELATYDGKAVLVEWKVVETANERQLKHRIKTLATLLQDIDSTSFHSLKCLGYLKDPKSENYGYAFQLPPESSDFVTLDCLLNGHSTAPSLDDRFALAIALVETVLQLHTSGWLHKGLRSENVIFFRQKQRPGLDITRVFLEGYEYARADNPSDMTESPRPQQEANLYRHPKLLRADRASFRKAFDLYGLGCILTEIGLWETLATTLLHFHRKTGELSQFSRIPPVELTYESKEEALKINRAKVSLLAAKGKGSIDAALNFAAGKMYAGVVRRCLSAGDDKKNTESAHDEEDIDVEDDTCIDLELDILNKLKKWKN
ncbi:prion-inhibition and propagation-domain-containing protein [Leptodontidium sp. MPI-SDFR-AT-0119]|nr:prion-inhibition and propagation-domain-containing protein [Leptodontidium sp. MPI-SDFR-AT-0119]